MQAKIIQVIEITEYEPGLKFPESNLPMELVPKRKYFLPDGTELKLYDRFAPQPADPNISVDVHKDGSVTASTISAH